MSVRCHTYAGIILLLKTTLCYSGDVVDDHYKNTRRWGVSYTNGDLY